MKTITHLSISGPDAEPTSTDLIHAVSQFQDGCSTVSGLTRKVVMELPTPPFDFRVTVTDPTLGLSDEELKALINNFVFASLDPMGGVIATRYGIDVTVHSI